MKKIYSTPTIEVVKIGLETMIAESINGTNVYNDKVASSTNDVLSNERRGIFSDNNRATLDRDLW